MSEKQKMEEPYASGEKRMITPIAYAKTDLAEKFGVPRQAGLAPALLTEIRFAPAYRAEEALRGLEDFSHLWLIWGFSKVKNRAFSPTVRPPRLGGNVRMGVFATRSPFRPNGLGLSCVTVQGIEKREGQGHVLLVGGADLVDGTPIYDIKPYIPYADAHPQASGGFAQKPAAPTLCVRDPKAALLQLPKEKREALCQVLALDPRPAYAEDGDRVYGMEFAGYNIRFRVAGGVVEILTAESRGHA